MRRARVLHHAFGAHAEGDRLVSTLLARFRREARNPKRGPTTVTDPTELLHAMRLVKAPEEIALLERSAAIAAAAHREARRLAKPGLFEYQLEAAIDSRFRAMGASGPAYPTIVASGRERDDPPLHREPAAHRRGRPRPRGRGLRGWPDTPPT